MHHPPSSFHDMAQLCGTACTALGQLGVCPLRLLPCRTISVFFVDKELSRCRCHPAHAVVRSHMGLDIFRLLWLCRRSAEELWHSFLVGHQDVRVLASKVTTEYKLTWVGVLSRARRYHLLTCHRFNRAPRAPAMLSADSLPVYVAKGPKRPICSTLSWDHALGEKQNAPTLEMTPSEASIPPVRDATVDTIEPRHVIWYLWTVELDAPMFYVQYWKAHSTSISSPIRYYTLLARNIRSFNCNISRYLSTILVNPRSYSRNNILYP